MRLSGEGKIYFDRMLERQLLFIGFCESPGWISGQCRQLASGKCKICQRLLCSDCKIKSREELICETCEKERTVRN